MCRFIDLGALLNITPLHLATALGDVASMKVLLDNGATQLPVCRGVLIDPQVVRPLSVLLVPATTRAVGGSLPAHACARLTLHASPLHQ